MQGEKTIEENEVNVTDIKDVPVPNEIQYPVEPVKSEYVKFLNTYPRLILLFFFIATIGLAVWAVGVFNVLQGGGFLDPNSESFKTNNYFAHFDNVSSSADVVALMSHDVWTVDDPEFKDAYFVLKQKLLGSVPISKVESFFDYPEESSGMVSTDRHMALMSAGLPNSVLEYVGAPPYSQHDFDATAEGNPLTVTFGGDYLSNVEVDEQITADLNKMETGGVPVLLVLLVFANGGVVAVSAPILLTIWTIIGTFAALHTVALGFNVSTYVTDVVALFGTGLAIDFTLFMFLRFHEEMMRHNDNPAFTPAHAVEKALKTSGKTVFFSMLMIVCTLTAALQFAEYFITTMSLAIMFPAIFACIGSLTFIPCLYLVLGRNMFLLSVQPITDYVRTVSTNITDYLFSYIPVVTISERIASSEGKEIEMIKPKPQAVNQPKSGEDLEANAGGANVDGTMTVQKSDDQGDAAAEHKSIEDTEVGNLGAEQEKPKGDKKYVPLQYTDNDPELDRQHNDGAEAAQDSKRSTSTAGGNTSKVVPHSAAVATLCKRPHHEYRPEHLSEKEMEEERRIRNGIWFRTVTFVMTYPWPFLAAMLAGLIALMVVFITEARFANQQYGNLPLDSPSRYIIETTNTRFPSSNSQTSLDVYLQTKDALGVRSAEFLTLMNTYVEELQSYAPFVVGVTSMVNIDNSKNLTDYITYYSDPYSPEHYNFTHTTIDPYALTNLKDVAHISVALDIPLSDKKLGRVVRHVRELTARSFFTTTDPSQQNDDTQLLKVWGTAGSAFQYDMNESIAKTLPNVIAVVLPSMFIFVLLMTSSILMPLKAIVTVFLSLCASFGLVKLIVQDGAGHHLLQFDNNLACLDPLQMIFSFLVALGLSMDYEIFMLGRIQEVYRKTGDNMYSVARGIETSARSVTMAAMLLCTAVGGFLASEVLLLKQLGIGIGLTIVLDATLVRCIFVPAVMAVLGGDINWYAPKFINDIVEYLGIQEKEDE